jgi:hypothetical protein
MHFVNKFCHISFLPDGLKHSEVREKVAITNRKLITATDEVQVACVGTLLDRN